MVTLVLPQAGVLEFVLAEPEVEIRCNAGELNKETAVFPKSEENRSLKNFFYTRTNLAQKQSWLLEGADLFSSNAELITLLEKEELVLDQSIRKLQQEIEQSTLYAARYYKLADFLNRLYNIVQGGSDEQVQALTLEQENSLDIPACYHSGELWTAVHNLYISMFARKQNAFMQIDYAGSILRTFDRLQPPYNEAYLASSITETERFGWGQAQSAILA
jgi:hypothetical protein